MSLCALYGVTRWHIASRANKPYVLDIVTYLKRRNLNTVVEVGCGFCDIISHLRVSRRIGYDADRNVVRAARLYTRLKFARVEVQPLNFITDAVPDVQANVWIIVNWLHEFDEQAIRRPLRTVFERLAPGGMMILDSVASPAYRYHHKIQHIFNGLPCQFNIITRDPSNHRTVFCVVKGTG